MKKLLTISLFAGLTALLFTSCKGKDQAAGGDPKTVITAFFERMSKKDIDGAAKLCTEDSKTTLDMMKKAIDAAEKMKVGTDKKEDDGTEDFKDMEVGEAKIDGDNATVSVTNKKKNETVAFPLKKEKGAWKVDFTMGTLMKMGMDAQKDGDMNMDNNSLDTTGLKDLQNLMNSDTLKDRLEKAKDMIEEGVKEEMEKTGDNQ